MKRLLVVLSVLAGLVVGAQASTIAWWNFESDLIAGAVADGTRVSHPSANAVHDAAIADLSGNGNHLSIFSSADWAAMAYSANVAPNNQTASNFSVTDIADAPGLFNVGDLELGGTTVGDLPTWTIEASVSFRTTGGWQTFVGKDGFQVATNGGDMAAASLYFQKVGDGTQLFRLNFVDAAGNTHIANSTTTAVVGDWYHLAATSDGSWLRLYVNGVEEKAVDLSGSANSAMVALDESAFEGTGTTVPYSWSLARGMYNDGHGDRLDGYLDDVRISDLALSPSEFLFIPEPSTLVLLGLGGMLAALRRRR